uniref:type 4 pilus major pilin n=2 Tax=Escherichia coli TaxID=562 RepID=UPI002883154D|nr:type 4 pilus major pilin [Escherichia coli]WNI98294.1 type 4 pilus major pilin [Escherichia coli]
MEMKPDVLPAHNDCPQTNGTSRSRRWKARGIEMLSAMGWWSYAIIIVVCVLGMLFGLYVFGRSGSEASNLTQLATATQRVARTQAGYGTASLNTVLYNAGQIPNGWTYSSGTIYNQWNGTVTVTGKTSYFTITDTGIPSSECISIAQSLAAGGVANYLTVGGTKITPASDIATINTACGNANSSVNSTTKTIVMYVGALQ